MTEQKKGVLEKLSAINPILLADYFVKLTPRITLRVARALNKKDFGLSLIEMTDEQREEILRKLQDKEIAQILNVLVSDDATDIVNSLEKARVKRILKLLKPEKLEEIKQLLRFGEETAGGLMQSEFVAVKAGDTVKKAIEKIREEKHIEELHNVFVLKGRGELVGIVPLRKLVVAQPNEKISSLMEKEIVSVKSNVDQEEVVSVFKENSLVSMPVLDCQNRMLGVITADDILGVVEEEATEDILRLAGVDEEENIFSSPLASIKRRTPWLAFNLLIVMVSASVIGLFEDTIATVLVLAIFLPVVANLGGNAGTQTLAVMVRSLALGEIGEKEYKRALKKEVTVGLMNGLIIGTLLLLIAVAWKGQLMIGVVLFLAMLANQLTAAVGGTLVPLLFKWRKIDPALASSVIITGMTDIMGFLAFLGIATLFLQMGLLA